MPKLFGTVYVQFFICTVLKADLHHTTENLHTSACFLRVKTQAKLPLCSQKNAFARVYAKHKQYYSPFRAVQSISFAKSKSIL